MSKLALLAALATLACIGSAEAQSPTRDHRIIGVARVAPVCPEGRLAGGACVPASLAVLMRRTAIVATQARLSRTAPLVPPALDIDFRYPYNLLGGETALSGHKAFYIPY